MKIAVLSDIHGNRFALESVLNDIDQNNIDQIIILGDLITDLPQETNTVLNMIRKTGTYIIQGNRENILLNKKELFEYDQFLTISLTRNGLSDENLKFIASLPEQISIIYDARLSIQCVHGSPFLMFEQIIETDTAMITNSLNSVDTKMLLCGHTHKQWYKHISEKIILNPGSVGINNSGDKSANYAVIKYNAEKISVELKKIKYDFNAFKASCDLDIPWVRLCVKGIEDGKEYTSRFLEEAKNKTNQSPIPNEVWNSLFKEWRDKKIV